MIIEDIVCYQDIVIEPVGDRWYTIPHCVDIDIYIEGCGRKHIHLDAGFLFDGRSGGPGADLIAPNLGTQEEVKAWLAHDICFFDTTGFSFSESNYILYWQLRNKCGYGWWRAKTVYWTVGLFGEGNFGEPAPNEREFPNLAKIHVSHYDK